MNSFTSMLIAGGAIMIAGSAISGSVASSPQIKDASSKGVAVGTAGMLLGVCILNRSIAENDD